MESTRSNRRPIHPASYILAAAGCLGIGTLLGGWAAEQPAQRSTNRNTNRNTDRASNGQVAGIAVDSRGNFLYRSFTNGRVERLPLGQGVTQGGTTAEWQTFKAP